MGILYEDNPPPFTGRPIPYLKQNATKHYLRHYSNMLILQAMEKAPKDANEHRRVNKEIQICQKKLDYWQKHANFNHQEATEGCLELKRQWK
jgi:hypothetical protein